ncbi:MAG: hypothetical protein ACPLZH_01450, partial [Minisyncoccales bacterium]
MTREGEPRKKIERREEEIITEKEVKDYFTQYFPSELVNKTNFDYILKHLPSLIREKNLEKRLNALAQDFGMTREELIKKYGHKILGFLPIFGCQQEKENYSLRTRLNALAQDFGMTREELIKKYGHKILGYLPIFGCQQEKENYSLRTR